MKSKNQKDPTIVKKKTPRSVRMLDKLKFGLEEYVRLYNPVTTKWRELKLRGNQGKNRIRLVGIDDYESEDSYQYSSDDDYASGDELRRAEIENDDILAPVFEKRRLGKRQMKRAGSLDNLRTASIEPHESSRQVASGSQTHRTVHEPVKDVYSERKESMKSTLEQMGAMNSKSKSKRSQGGVSSGNSGGGDASQRHPITKDKSRTRSQEKLKAKRLSERRISLSVIKESPTKVDFKSSVNPSPSKQSDIKEEDVRSVHSPIKSGSSKRSFPRRDSRGSIEEPVSFGVGGRRNQRQRRRRQTLGGKFRRMSKFFLVLYRLWKNHAKRVNEMLDSFDALDALVGTKPEKKKDDDLYFDLGIYKSHNEAKLPREAKRILQLQPGTRTEEELHYLKIALRNYQSIVEYPMRMQMMLSERAWYENYNPKRVIVREGQKPLNFYFILSGTVIISKYDKEKNINKTVTFLGKGDSFGESAILNNTEREASVISKENVEFLVITHEDFKEIFASGGLGNPKDQFLTSLWYFNNWPLIQLGKNTKKATFTFYKRDVVLASDTAATDWLFIVKSRLISPLQGDSKEQHHHHNGQPISVSGDRKESSTTENNQEDIKTKGSVSVYKQLKFEIPDATKPKLIKKKKKKKKQEEHSDKLQKVFENQLSNLQDREVLHRLLLQPNELNIPVRENTDIYAGFGKKHPLELLSNQNSTLPKQDTSMVPSGTVSRERSSAAIDMKNNKRVTFSVSGPILTKSNMEPHPPALETDPTRVSVLSSSVRQHDKSTDPDEEEEDSEGKNEETDASHDLKPKFQFVRVQILIKGDCFGLADLIYGNQPSFSLVSNGAEVIKLDKRLYEDNASQRLMSDLRERIYPFPTDEDLQEMLHNTINWDFNCRSTLLHTLHDVGLRNASIHDARSTISLHKPTVPLS